MEKKQLKKEVECNRVGLFGTDPDLNCEILEEKPFGNEIEFFRLKLAYRN